MIKGDQEAKVELSSGRGVDGIKMAWQRKVKGREGHI